MKFHHLGLACRDLDEATLALRQAFPEAEVGPIVYDPVQDASLRMVSLADGTRIELVAGDVVEAQLRRGQPMYHSCWEVERLDEALSRLEDEGWVRVSDPAPAVLFEGRRVVFAWGPLGLTELLESGDARAP